MQFTVRVEIKYNRRDAPPAPSSGSNLMATKKCSMYGLYFRICIEMSHAVSASFKRTILQRCQLVAERICLLLVEGIYGLRVGIYSQFAAACFPLGIERVTSRAVAVGCYVRLCDMEVSRICCDNTTFIEYYPSITPRVSQSY